MADGQDIREANERLSRLLRSSVFPGAVHEFPKRSVTQEMLAQADPQNPEFKYVSCYDYHSVSSTKELFDVHINFFLYPSFDCFFSSRVTKEHFSMKYDLKNFMEAEFARRNLYKQVQKEAKG